MLILSKKSCFLTRTSTNTFFGCILHGTKRSQNFKFLNKMPILWVFETEVLLFRKARLLYKTSKIVFSRFMTWEYTGLQGVTGGYIGVTRGYRGYRGLQGVTRGYRGLQGVTGGYIGVTRSYKGLQGVKEGYKGLQWVTKHYRNFFLTRTFPDTFSWSILHKNQS